MGRKTVSQIWAFYANIDISHHGLLYDLDIEGFKWPLFFSQKGDKISNLSYSQLKKMSKEIVCIKYVLFLLLSFLEDWKQIKMIFKTWQ